MEIWKDYGDEQRDLLASHGVGHLFGEMAVVDDLPRSATVVARDAVRLLSVGRDDFRGIVASNGAIALSITRSVSAMVRASNESFLENLHRRNRALLKANRELRRAQERLIQAERLSVLGKFASLILHDIRNPIAILQGVRGDGAARPGGPGAGRAEHRADHRGGRPVSTGSPRRCSTSRGATSPSTCRSSTCASSSPG